MYESFKTIKRVNPSVTWVSTNSGVTNRVFDKSSASDIPVSVNSGGANTSGQLSTGYPVATGGGVNALDTVLAHWSADARLGVI